MIGKLKLKRKKSEELINNLKKNKQTGDLSEVTSTRKINCFCMKVIFTNLMLKIDQ